MTMKTTNLGSEVRLDGTLAVFDYRDMKPYLIEGGNDAENKLLFTTDANMSEHFRQVGGKVFKILDDNFLQALRENVPSLCGNCYSYVNKASLKGIVRQEQDEFLLVEISMAKIVDDEGNVTVLEL